MTKFNQTLSIAAQLTGRSDATANHEGGLAFEMEPATRLYTRACTSLVREDKFYTSADQADGELLADIRTVAAIAPEFVLRLAAYVRQVMNLRTVPLVMLAEAASIPACKPFVRRWTPQVLRRVDELAEVVAYWKLRHGDVGARGQKGGEHAFPNSLSNGIGDAFGQFDEYQLSKYDRKGSVTLRDVLRIVRPKPVSEEQAALYRYLVKGEVDVTFLPKTVAKAQLLRKMEFDAEARVLAQGAHATWEVMTSHFGRKAEVWDAVYLPFMAGMRNLGNLLEVGADKAIDRVVAMLRNPGQVRRSKQLPFRFYSAYKAVERRVAGSHPRRQEVLEALREALELSAGNLPRLSGRSFVTTDLSGSMSQAFSKDSTVSLREIGCLMASALHSACDNAIVSVFGSDHRVVSVSPQDTILTNMDLLHRQGDLGGTDAWKTVRHLNTTKTRVDRIVLFSDMQCYDSGNQPRGWGGESYSLAEELRRYRSSVNPDVHMVSVDLAGYGTSQVPTDDPKVTLLAGWSDRVLEFIALREAGTAKVLEMINAWSPFGEAAPEASSEADDGAES